jgi:hypothetical protein
MAPRLYREIYAFIFERFLTFEVRKARPQINHDVNIRNLGTTAEMTAHNCQSLNAKRVAAATVDEPCSLNETMDHLIRRFAINRAGC